MPLINIVLNIYKQNVQMICEILQQVISAKTCETMEAILTAPIATISVLMVIVLATLWQVWKDHKAVKYKVKSFEERLKEFSSSQKLMLSIKRNKQQEGATKFDRQNNASKSMDDLLNIEVEEPKLRSKMIERSKLVRTTLLYITSEERAQKKRELEQIQMQKKRQAKRRQQEERRIKEQKKKITFQQQTSKDQKQGQQITSNQSVRSSERKTTIQKTVQSLQGSSETKINEQPKTFSIFNNPSLNMSTVDTNKVEKSNNLTQRQQSKTNNGINIQSTQKTTQKQQQNSINNQAPKKEQALNQNNQTQGSFFNHSLPQKPKNSNQSKNNETKIAPATPPSLPNISVAPASAPTLVNAPVSATVQVKLSTSEYFQQLMKFAESQRSTVEISTIMANLGGAQSSLNNVLISAQSLISSIKKSEDAQQTTFALKLFESIIYQIKSSNARDGLYQIPPKSKTSQAQKNAINRYALTVNIYRLMGYQKIWMIVLGKTLRLLQFTYKRQHDIKKLIDLDLLANKHMDMVGQVEPKYLSRIDYLTYFLMGLLAFDPISIYRQVEEKDPAVRQSREEVQNLGREWSYKQFWIYLDLVLKNKHQSYFKPILYMNILSSLFSKIFENKKNPSNFRQYALLYQTLIDLSKKFFANYEKNTELKALRQEAQGPNYIIDGDNMIQMIKPLNSRLCIEKFNNFNQRSSDPARDFQVKENIFYYFCKER